MTDLERIIGSTIAISFWACILALGVGELVYRVALRYFERRERRR